MKAVIGDIHGRDFWKKTLEDGALTDIYCVGDYWDTHDGASYAAQRRNFVEIVEAARRDRRLHLCVGNHDLHYIAPGEEYSGRQTRYGEAIGRLIVEALPLLRVGYEADGWVISHAGFSRTFMREANCASIGDVQKRFDADFGSLGFNMACGNVYGDDPEQGPLWIRPESLWDDMFFPRQIVGHTPVETIVDMADGGKRLVLVDTNGAGEAFVF